MGASGSKRRQELQRKADFGWRDATLCPLSEYSCTVERSTTVDFSIAALLKSIPPPASMHLQRGRGPSLSLRHQRTSADVLCSVEDMDVLNAILREWPVHHRVHACDPTDDTGGGTTTLHPYVVVSHGPVIEHVDLSGHVEMGVAHLRRFFGRRSSALIGLHVAGGASPISDTLTSLNFSGTSIGDDGTTYLCRVLFPQHLGAGSGGSRQASQRVLCPALSALVLDDCGMTDVGCRVLAAHVLRRNQMASEGGSPSPLCRSIVTLSLAHNCLTDASCSVLADLLGAASATHIPCVPAATTGLMHLNLYGNPLGDDGFVMLLLRGVCRRMATLHRVALGHHDAVADGPPLPPDNEAVDGAGDRPGPAHRALDRPYTVMMQSPSPYRALQSLRRVTAVSDAAVSPSPLRKRPDAHAMHRGVSPPPRQFSIPVQTSSVPSTTLKPHRHDDNEATPLAAGVTLGTSCCSLTLASISALVELFGNAHDERVLHAIALLEELQQHEQQLAFALDAVPSSARGAVRSTARKEALVHAVRRALHAAQSFPQCTSLSGTRQLRFDTLRCLHLANAAMGDDGVELLAAALSRFSASAAGLSERLADTQRHCDRRLAECESSKPCISGGALFPPSSDTEHGAADLCFVGPTIFLEEIDLSGVGCTARGVRALTSALFGRCGSCVSDAGAGPRTFMQRIAGVTTPICEGCTQPFLRTLNLSFNTALGGTHGGNLLAAFSVHASSAMHHHAQYLSTIATDPFNLGTTRHPDAYGETQSSLFGGRYRLSLTACGLQDDALEVWASRCARDEALVQSGFDAARASLRAQQCGPTAPAGCPGLSLVTTDLSNNKCTHAGLVACRDALGAAAAQISSVGDGATDRKPYAAAMTFVDCLIDGNLVMPLLPTTSHVYGPNAVKSRSLLRDGSGQSWFMLRGSCDPHVSIRTTTLSPSSGSPLHPQRAGIGLRHPPTPLLATAHRMQPCMAGHGNAILPSPPDDEGDDAAVVYDESDVDGLIANSERVLLRWAA